MYLYIIYRRRLLSRLLYVVPYIFDYWTEQTFIFYNIFNINKVYIIKIIPYRMNIPLCDRATKSYQSFEEEVIKINN